MRHFNHFQYAISIFGYATIDRLYEDCGRHRCVRL